MAEITATDVSKLRKQTGVGMMDCKKALVESNGDFEVAIDVLRKKGQKVAAKRANREAIEGVVIAGTNEGNSKAIIVSLNCETDFVAKNNDFITLAYKILEAAIANNVSSSEELNGITVDGIILADKIIEQTGVIGEKLEVSMEAVEGTQVSAYIHSGNRLATIVAFNTTADEQVLRDVAMQVAAMNPIAINKEGITQEIIDRELEVGKDLAKQEGKPEEMLEKIAFGRLNKFFKENTLLNQAFIKDGKKSVQQHLKDYKGDLTVTTFKRVGLGV